MGHSLHSSPFRGRPKLTIEFTGSFTKTVGTTVGMTYNETAPQDFLGRWVFFPKLIHSCGSHSKQELESPAPPPCSGDLCTPPTAPSECVGEVVTTPNVCSLSPALDDKGNPSVFPTVRKYDPRITSIAYTVGKYQALIPRFL